MPADPPSAVDLLTQHSPRTRCDALTGCGCGWGVGSDRAPTLGEFATHQAIMLATAGFENPSSANAGNST